MDPFENLRASHPAFRGINADNITDYFAMIVPRLLIEESQRSGSFEMHPMVGKLTSELGDLILKHFVSTKEDSNKYNVICNYLMDQTIITKSPVIRQVVIMDMVMDSSAYRIPEMDGCRAFELQLHSVVTEEKERLLRECGAKLIAAERQNMTANFKKDGWQRVLLSRGFDQDQPTLWIVGSILSYMTVFGGAHLVSLVEALSAPGSQVYADVFSGHKVEITDNVESVVRVNAPASFELHGDDARVFQKLSKWTVELLARRDSDFHYYGTMWDHDKLDNLRVKDRLTGYLGPWFAVRFSAPARDQQP